MRIHITLLLILFVVALLSATTPFNGPEQELQRVVMKKNSYAEGNFAVDGVLSVTDSFQTNGGGVIAATNTIKATTLYVTYLAFPAATIDKRFAIGSNHNWAWTSDSGAGDMRLETVIYSNTSGHTTRYNGYRAGGNEGNASRVGDGWSIMGLYARPHNGSTFTDSAQIEFLSGESVTSSKRPTSIVFRSSFHDGTTNTQVGKFDARQGNFAVGTNTTPTQRFQVGNNYLTSALSVQTSTAAVVVAGATPSSGYALTVYGDAIANSWDIFSSRVDPETKKVRKIDIRDTSDQLVDTTKLEELNTLQPFKWKYDPDYFKPSENVSDYQPVISRVIGEDSNEDVIVKTAKEVMDEELQKWQQLKDSGYWDKQKISPIAEAAPDDVCVFDEEGNKIGIDMVAYTSKLYQTIDSLEKRIQALEGGS